MDEPMTISNDCWISINLNELVKDRVKFLNTISSYADIQLNDDEIQETASELRTRMTFDSLFEQTDMMIWEIADNQEMLPQYGQIAPEPGREDELNRREKAMKEFEMVDLVSPSWTIKVPRRKT
jgi:hypothetical protein